MSSSVPEYNPDVHNRIQLQLCVCVCVGGGARSESDLALRAWAVSVALTPAMVVAMYGLCSSAEGADGLISRQLAPPKWNSNGLAWRSLARPR
jgi:hypothetical protein